MLGNEAAFALALPAVLLTQRVAFVACLRLRTRVHAAITATLNAVRPGRHERPGLRPLHDGDLDTSRAHAPDD